MLNKFFVCVFVCYLFWQDQPCIPCRYTYLLDTYLKQQHAALFVGPTGTGKSIYITQHLQSGLPAEFLNMNVKFSAQV